MIKTNETHKIDNMKILNGFKTANISHEDMESLCPHNFCRFIVTNVDGTMMFNIHIKVMVKYNMLFLISGT